MEYRKAAWNKSGGIDMEVNHSELGWIPFTARSDDPEKHGRDLYSAARGTAVPYAPPTANEIRSAAYVTKRDFLAAVDAAGILTKTQRLTAAKGEWPEPLAPALTGMDESAALEAQIQWAEATHIARLHPIVLFLAEHLELTDTQVDALFGLDGLE